jgi:lipopolysaccharide export LptBFGC system permease protein LptF
VYPKVSGLAAWSENCKWYISLPLGAVVSLFAAITLCVASQRVFIVIIVVVVVVVVIVYFVIDSVRKLLDTLSYSLCH